VTEEPTEEPTEESTDEVTEEPTEEVTEEPTATPTEETEVPDEVPTGGQDGTDASGAVADVGSSGNAESTAEATEDATSEPTEEPTEEPAPKPTFESRTGSSELRIELRLCPAGMTPEDFDPEECGRANGNFSLALVTPFGEELRLRHANRYDDDFVRWSQLKSGEYVLEVREFPKGYSSWSLDQFVCCTQDDGFRIRLGREESVVGTIYFFRS
jgi:hypothetical protein